MDYDLLLPTVLARFFPDPEVRAQIEAGLSQYGTESFHSEGPRVKTAVLKVALPNLP